MVLLVRAEYIGVNTNVTQQVSRPPEETEQQPVAPLLPPGREPGFSRPIIILWLAAIGILLLLFTGQAVRYAPQLLNTHLKSIVPAPHVAGIVPATGSAILQVPGQTSQSSIQLPAGRYIVYEQKNTISIITTEDSQPRVLNTPGYLYNRSVSPLLTPDGRLLYSGNGLWLTSISGGSAQQIAPLPADQVITSLVLSSDGTTVAWSTAPLVSNGDVTIYAGPLQKSVPVYQHPASDCPCFRVFSFFGGAAKQSNSTLLLADDRGNHQAVQYGLWSLNLAQKPLQKPHQLLSSTKTAGPQTLAPAGNTFLYSSYEGFMPAPNDTTAPGDTASLTYANSLNIATLSNSTTALGTGQVILPEQNELSNIEAYRWITTPRFAPDGHTLLYVEFSSDASPPYDRHSALYSVQITGSGASLKVGTPQLVATTPAYFIELGAWLNEHIITFYADGALYAFDIQNGTYKQLIQTNFYMRIAAVGSQG